MDNETLVPIGAIQHYSYCPRQFYLIYIDNIWCENSHTAIGRALHTRVDSHEFERRNDVEYQRSLLVSAPDEHLYGKLDLLEHDVKNNIYIPIEYKKGKVKAGNYDKLQLCAQAMAISEMTGEDVNIGYLWYFEIRRRIEVQITDELIKETRKCVNDIIELYRNQKLPSAITVPKFKCRGGSLFEKCQPNISRNDHSEKYVSELINCL